MTIGYSCDRCRLFAAARPSNDQRDTYPELPKQWVRFNRHGAVESVAPTSFVICGGCLRDLDGWLTAPIAPGGVVEG